MAASHKAGDKNCCGGGGGGTHVLSGCPCAALPDVIVIDVPVVDLTNYPFILPDTLTWQARPSDVAASGTGGGNPGYHGDTVQVYTPAHSGSYRWRYFLDCNSLFGVYRLGLNYTNDSDVSPGSSGYLWNFPAHAGNTCSPFAYTFGFSTDTSDTSTGRIHIHG